MDSKGLLASAVIRSARKAFAAGAALRMQERHPEWTGFMGSFADLAQHNETLLDHLSAALEVDRPRLFGAHVAWLSNTCAARGVAAGGLRAGLMCLREEMQQELPAQAAPIAVACIDSALPELESERAHGVGALACPRPFTPLADRYLELALSARREDAIAMLMEAQERGLSVADSRLHVLGAAQIEIGERWQLGLANVAEEHLCSRTTERALGVVAANSVKQPRNGSRLLITSVAGDLHDIGPRILADEFESAGWSVLFLGANTPAADIVLAAEAFDPHVVALGAKLTTHLRSLLDTIVALKTSERAKRIPVLVGGTPFDIVPDLWRVVGADASAADASEAVEMAEKLGA